jgi:hypothetical protein
MVRLDGRMMPHWSMINIADNSDRGAIITGRNADTIMSLIDAPQDQVSLAPTIYSAATVVRSGASLRPSINTIPMAMMPSAASNKSPPA